MSKKLSLILTSVIVIISFIAGCSSKETSLRGYLIDKHCFDNKISASSNKDDKTMTMDNKDSSKDMSSCMTTDNEGDPSKETKDCLTMKMCADSGYGLTLKDKDGKFIFYKFDSKGNDLAEELLKNSKKKDDFQIEVNGELSGSTIKVVSITEKGEK